MQPAIPRSASSSTRPPSGASPLPRSHQQTGVKTNTKILDTTAGRILCIADVRGRLSSLNDLAREANAQAVIHTGDFGFFGACLRNLLPPFSSIFIATKRLSFNGRLLSP